MQQDARGVPVTGGSKFACDQYEVALRQFQSYVGDPIATIDAALADSPPFVVGPPVPRAGDVHDEREVVACPRSSSRSTPRARCARSANDRERGLMARDAAVRRRRLERRLPGARPRAERASARRARAAGGSPDGLLSRRRAQPAQSRVARAAALERVGAGLFLRARHARVRARGDEPVRRGGGDRAPRACARAQGRLGRARGDARDGDAGAHRRRRGLARVAREPDWSPDNAFAFHNWWHLALFHLDAGRYDDALALYDAQRPPGSGAVRAVAASTRRRCCGACISKAWTSASRFATVADEWEARLEQDRGFYAFNDVHAMLAFVATGRAERDRALAANLALAAAGSGTNAMMSRDVGPAAGAGHRGLRPRPLRRGDRADRAGARHRAPVRRQPRAARPHHADADRGGAARRAGERAARHYIAERLVHKPAGRLGRPARAARGGAPGAVTPAADATTPAGSRRGASSASKPSGALPVFANR